MYIDLSEYGTFEKDVFHFNILPLQNGAKYIDSITNINSPLYKEYIKIFNNLDITLDKANEGLILIENGVM